MKTKLHACFLLLFSGICSYFPAVAQRPEVKIDMNMSGRPLPEVNEPGYTPWAIANGGPDSLNVNGVQFAFSKGARGAVLAMTYYKAGVQSPNLARLTCDALYVKDGDFALASEIILTIKGLPAGKHTLTTYHNATDNLTAATVCPMDVYVNDVLRVNDLIPTIRVFKETDCAAVNLEITAEAGKEVVIRYKAEESGPQTVKNVYINAIHLNVINAALLSRTPFPAHKEEHLEAPGNAYVLRWEAAPSALSHDVYFGKDSAQVADADRNSPLFKGNAPRSDSFYAVSKLYSMDTYYWRVDEVDAAGTHKGNVWMFRTRQLAFPDAEGYGRFARGGRGGRVVEVTNLNDAGPGSLREAITADIGPRTIVFKVAGIITLTSRLVASQPYITIAGQTAPGKGICLRGAPLGITGNDNIARHLRMRLGAGPTYDGMGLTGANHSIIDHCSISWTIDESFSSRGGKNITLQRTLISEALNVAGHQNYPAGTGHGYAATIGGDVGSFHHNLLAHNQGRNWSMGGGLDGNAFYSGRLDIVNNVVYNWQKRTTDGGAMEVNFVNNYYKRGASSTTRVALTANHEGTGKGSQRYYFAGNVMPGVFNEANQEAGRNISITNGAIVNWETFVNAPFFPSYINIQPASQAYKNVLSDVGCTQPGLDNHDIRMINETRDSTYSTIGSKSGLKGLIDHQDDAGGYGNYPEVTRADDWDSDHDGMPDWWEVAKGTNPHSASGDFSESNADTDRDGVTQLEAYLNWMAIPHISEKENTPMYLDLKTLSAGYTASPVITVHNAVNGSVTVNAGVARFSPSQKGLGAFAFTVTDSEGATFTRTVNTYSGSSIDKTNTAITFTGIRKDAATVALRWNTENEFETDHFEVERSFTGGNDFVQLGAGIPSKGVDGSSAAALNYELIDTNGHAGNTWYRLVHKDRLGKMRVSDVQIVRGTGFPGVHVWPVPNRGDFNVLVNSTKEECFLRIYNLLGCEVARYQFPAQTRQPVHLSQRGLFVLMVTSKSGKLVGINKVLVY
ncbi:hypothetical protein HNQ91_002405 [Filimonas zeae]|nr:T9SS C-terminal target domain-containing protein [Filimonas zeae]MDR6339354.1 hypothetical protein [Filimonas zeae]